MPIIPNDFIAIPSLIPWIVAGIFVIVVALVAANKLSPIRAALIMLVSTGMAMVGAFVLPIGHLLFGTALLVN